MISAAANLSTNASLLEDVSAAQNHASDPQRSVWVSASAGSGKTKVLADRVTRLLLSGVKPERLLCLTFTRAAAAEMSIRLSQRLARWAACGEDESGLAQELKALEGRDVDRAMIDKARRLFAQVLSCPGGMRIQTIHSFAQEVLHRFPTEAGIAPHFTLLEDADCNALKHEALHEVLRTIAGKPSSLEAKALAELVGESTEKTITSVLADASKHIETLAQVMAACGGVASYQRALREKVGLKEKDTPETLCRAACKDKAFDRELLKRAAQMLVEKGSKKFSPRGEAILAWIALPEQERAKQLDDYRAAFLTNDGEPYKNMANKELAEANPWLIEALESEASRLMALDERMETAQFITQTGAFVLLSLRINEAYARKKRRVAALDYEDLIAEVNALLSRSQCAPWVLFKLDGGIDHILVDESQDTNPSQWKFIKALTNDYFSGESARRDGERTLFVVGDEKQSIYSFQKADPEEYARTKAHYFQQTRGLKSPIEEVHLTVSFRSAPAILRAVDAVFARDEVRRGVSHVPITHSAFRRDGAGRVEVWKPFVPPEGEIKKKETIKEPVDWEMPLGYEIAYEPIQVMAATIADKIKTWVAQGVSVYDRDLKKDRSVRFGDVLILVQRRKEIVDVLIRAFKRAGVPVSGADRMVITDQLAVMDLMALIQFVLLPEDDLNLATVLKGPLIGASEEDLMDLAIGRSGSLWGSLQHRASSEPRFAVWRDYLLALAAQADQKDPFAWLSDVLVLPCPFDPRSGRRAFASRLGPDAEDPLDELLRQAQAFSARHVPSLHLFLDWLLSSETDIKREMEQGEDRVRIMTVHASKGLEAPVVILPDTMREPALRSVPRFLWDESLLFYVPRAPKNEYLRGLRNVAARLMKEENRRLLYVALTRAADRLYVCGSMNKDDSEGKADSWYAMIRQGLLPYHQPDAATDELCEIVVADKGEEKRAPDSAERVEGGEALELPLWALQPPAQEPFPPRPLVPSHQEAEEDVPTTSPRHQRFARGKILHRLLQSLPEIEPDRREEAARRFLAHQEHQLPAQAQKELAQEVLGLVNHPDYAPLFSPDSRAEQPIVGVCEGRYIAGQVDRLALVCEEVWIVDYKTNRPPPQEAALIPTPYLKQMEAYRSVLQAIYPDRAIRCFLLWTFTACLMEVKKV